MGALRASELDTLGMKGIGYVYEQYATGKVTSDDDVAVMLDSETLEQLSEPLINMEYSFTNNEHVLSGKTYDLILSYKPTFPNTSIKKLAPKKKSFKINFKKCSNVSGYQVKYSTKKNMSSSKTAKASSSSSSKTVKSLKSKKKYYVKVRTYKTVKINGKNKTYYGKWSKIKTVKTK